MASPPKKAFKGKVKGLVVKYEKVHPRKGTLSRFRGMSVVKKQKVHHKAPQKRDKRDFRW